MPEIALLAAFWAAFLLALVSPGPNFAVIAGTALREGRRRALGTAFGLAGGEAVWAVGAVLGVSALAARHPGRFAPSAGLTALASEGGRFHPRDAYEARAPRDGARDGATVGGAV